MAYLPYDPGDDVTELSPAVTQFTNNPAMVAITKKVRQFTDDPNKSNDPDWEYLPNISQRNDPGTMAATGGDNRAEAAVGGYGYSGDPDQMGPAIDFMKRMEDTYGDSIAREEREKQEIANSPSETYDPVGFRQAIVESLKYDPMKIDVVKEVDAKYGQVEQQIFSQMFPGKRWGKSSLTAKEYSVYDKARKDSYVMLHNEVQGKVDRGNDIIKQNLEMYDKEFKYKNEIRKEAGRKKEKEEEKAENLRRYKIAQDRLDKEKPNDFDKKTDFIRDRFGPNSLEMVNHMLGKKQGDGKKSGQNYLLEDKSIVTSFDGGRTFKSKDGKPSPMPFNAVKVTATIGGQDLSMLKAQKTAEKEQKITREMAAKDVAKIAKSGTGPYNMLAAAFDAIAGGMGIDLVLGKEGFFTETQENRQVLRTIKQIGKAALMNSSRGAIWEQQRIDRLFPDPDRFWRNPRTEMKKFETLREMLSIERAFNNEAIIAAVTPKEVSDLRKSNVDIDRLLALIKQGAPQNEGITPKRKMLLNKYPPKG